MNLVQEIVFQIQEMGGVHGNRVEIWAVDWPGEGLLARAGALGGGAACYGGTKVKGFEI